MTKKRKKNRKPVKNVYVKPEPAIPECPLCGKRFAVRPLFLDGVKHNILICKYCQIEIHEDDPFVGKWVTTVGSVAENTMDYVDLEEVPYCPICQTVMNTFARLDDYYKCQCTNFLCKGSIAADGVRNLKDYVRRVMLHKHKKITNKILMDEVRELNE